MNVYLKGYEQARIVEHIAWMSLIWWRKETESGSHDLE
jgi:hypothetical protein